MGVVMQVADFDDVETAKAWEAELASLCQAYIRFEQTDPAPWSMEKVPPPLAEFASRRGASWPLTEDSRVLLKGSFEDAVELLRVDRSVFFWGNGFELGGETLAEFAQKAGAIRVSVYSPHNLRVRTANAASRAAELAAFLDEEDHAGHYSVQPLDAPLPEYTLFSIALEDAGGGMRLVFDGSGQQDWAFVTVLPQLDGEDPRLEEDPPEEE